MKQKRVDVWELGGIFISVVNVKPNSLGVGLLKGFLPQNGLASTREILGKRV